MTQSGRESQEKPSPSSQSGLGVPQDVDAVADEILRSFGPGSVLVLGPSANSMIRSLLGKGVDARGVDISSAVVEHGNQCMPGRFTCGSSLSLPYEDGAFETIVSIGGIDSFSDQEMAIVVAEIRRVSRRNVYLQISLVQEKSDQLPTDRSREWWETQFFKVGFRKHAAYYEINKYSELNKGAKWASILLERVAGTALQRYPLSALSAEREIHIDMMRKAGRDSDAYLIRFQLAAQYIRPGDVVLNAACGLGAGAYLMHMRSFASRTIGIDDSARVINYADAMFAQAVDGLEYRHGTLLDKVKDISDNTVDVVVSFKSLECVLEPQALLAEFYRILAPSGRILVSISNGWSDEAGEGFNPPQRHVYTLQRLLREMKQYFILETVYEQTASRRKVGGPALTLWEEADYKLEPIVLAGSTDCPEPEGEWLLAVGMKDPSLGKEVPYREAVYENYDNWPAWNVTAFARDYRNPWLIKGMVTRGFRLKNEKDLLSLAMETAEDGDAGIADRGAALCVEAYIYLGHEEFFESDLVAFSRRCEEHLNVPMENPHQLRWSISISFALGRLWQRAGKFSQAMQYYRRCMDRDPLQFSPVLATKSVEAGFHLGVLALGSGDRVLAREAWINGISTAQRALHADWRGAVGDLQRPAEFGLRELSNVLSIASSCAYALSGLDDALVRPGPWWSSLVRDEATSLAKDLRLLKRGYDEIIEGNRWLIEQRNAWERLAKEADERIDALSSAYEELKAGIAWMTEQRDAWERKSNALQEEIQFLKGGPGARK